MTQVIPRRLPERLPDVPSRGRTGFPYGLGRNRTLDARDEAYPIRALLPKSVAGVNHRYWWDQGWWGDQDRYPHCVAYAWLHWMEDGPHTVAPRRPGQGPGADPVAVYREAQTIDEWPGEGYDGTSVRAGAKVLQRLGFIREYRWGWTLDDLVDAVLTLGPVVVGTWWYSGMFWPSSEGIIRVQGYRAGGHAYLINGLSLRTGMARVKNSWGRGWGRSGRAWIPLEDLERLIREDGEVCIAIQERTP